MTTAALIPYFLGRYLLGTATDRAGAELGEVRDRVGPGAHPKERVITADDYARAAASIVAWLRGRGVRRVAIEAPATSGASSERAARLVSGVVAALDAVGIVHEVKAGAAANRDDGEARLRWLLGDEGGGYGRGDEAGVGDGAPAKAEGRTEAEPRGGDGPQDASSGAMRGGSAGEHCGLGRGGHHGAADLPRVRKEGSTLAAVLAPDPKRPPEPPAPPSADATRIAGIDAGARHIAVTVADLYPDGRLAYVEKWPITLDQPSDDEIEALGRRIATWLVRCGVVNVAVERATHFHGGGDDAAKLGAMAAGVLRGQWIAASIWAACAYVAPALADASGAAWGVARGVSSAVWRRDARTRAGRVPHGGASYGTANDASNGRRSERVDLVVFDGDRSGVGRRPAGREANHDRVSSGPDLRGWVVSPEWRDAVRALYGGSLPIVLGSDHVLDAAGVCAWLAGTLAGESAAAHVPVERKKRERGAKLVKDMTPEQLERRRKSKREHSARVSAERSKAQRAARDAIGCNCNGRRAHSLTCPARGKPIPKAAA